MTGDQATTDNRNVQEWERKSMSDSKPDTSPEAVQEPVREPGDAQHTPTSPPTHANGLPERTASAQPEKPSAPSPARSTQPAALWLSLAALAVSLALAVAGFFFWDRQHQIAHAQSVLAGRIEARLSEVDSVINRVQTGYDQFKSSEESRLQAMAERVGRLSDAQRDQKGQLEHLEELIGRGNREWTLSEVEFLLALANRSVRLQRDVATAVAALGFADETLREINDPGFLAVRKRIAAEVDALKAVPVVDRDGLASGLAALIDRVDGLALGRRSVIQPDRDGAMPGDSTAPAPPAMDWKSWASWKRLPGVIWSAVRDLVRVREHDRPLEPLVAPEKAYFLRLNLRLQLESARLALLRGAPAIYRQSLETASGWIAVYFDENDPAVAAARERLAELVSINIRPELPDIAGSLNLLRQRRALSPGSKDDESHGGAEPAANSGAADAES
jgi:uroporphyrin-3 C-methyltransferase